MTGPHGCLLCPSELNGVSFPPSEWRLKPFAEKESLALHRNKKFKREPESKAKFIREGVMLHSQKHRLLLKSENEILSIQRLGLCAFFDGKITDCGE